MKRIDLIRHLEGHGVQFLREGGSHSVYVNRAAGKTSTILAMKKLTTLLRRRFAKTWKFQSRNSSDCIFNAL